MGAPCALDAAFQPANLKRAWRWLTSNPDRLYREICQTAYSEHSAHVDDLLATVGGVGRRGFFEASPIRRVELPKGPTLSRPYAVLTTQDQIVYQAMANLIAERLHPSVKHRHLTSSFSHIYAGKTSKTFYRPWQRCRREYNRQARRAVQGGLAITATFDIAACYESVSHAIVDRLLAELGLDQGFREAFRRFLGKWTMTEASGGPLEVGIPQGPAASGIVAELVLEAFDKEFEKPEAIEYLRYVDDIRLFGRDLNLLARRVWTLEQICRELGMHPQPSKVDIHPVTDINAELKSVSIPEEDWQSASGADQRKLRGRIFSLSRGGRVRDDTRFKFCVPSASPNARLTEHLLKVLENQPDLFRPVIMYLRKHSRISARCGERLLRLIKGEDIRSYVRAALVDAASGRLRREQDADLDRLARSFSGGPADSELRMACRKRLVRRGLVGQTPARRFVCSGGWWSRAELLRCLSNNSVSRRGLLQIIESQLRDGSAEVASAAAIRLAALGLAPQKGLAGVSPCASRILTKAFRVRRGYSKPCGINHALSGLLGRGGPLLRWRQILRGDYEWMEQQAIHVGQSAVSNPTAFANLLDAFLDGLLKSLYRLDRSLGVYQTGNIGAVLGSSRLSGSYPRITALVREVHGHRRASRYSHMEDRSTGKKTGTLSANLVGKVKAKLRAALRELSTIV